MSFVCGLHCLGFGSFFHERQYAHDARNAAARRGVYTQLLCLLLIWFASGAEMNSWNPILQNIFLPLGKYFLKWISGVQVLISKETKELHLHPPCCCSKGEHPLSSTTLQGLLGKDMSALLLKLTSEYVHLPLAWASSISERYWTRASKWKQWRQSRIERNQRFCRYCLHDRW